MRRKTVIGTMLTLLLIGMLTLAFNIQPVKASGTIYIRGNGDVDPSTAPIQRDGDLYTLTDDIFSDTDGIVIERNNMTLDGAGHILLGSGAGFSRGVSLSGRSNVTIKDFEIKEFTEGIGLITASNNSIHRNIVKHNNISISLSGGSHLNSLSNNTISSNENNGIVLLESDYNSITGNAIKKNEGDSGVKLDSASYNNITGNCIKHHSCGIWITSQSYDSVGNRICLNNFIDNTDQRSGVYLNNVWDNGTHGNFWSDYAGKDKNGDGVGDKQLPHQDVDYYPLMAIYSWYDITVESVTPSSTQVPIGTSMSIDVVVENQGGVTETFNVATFANAAVIGQTEVTLSSTDSTTITFTWDTTNFATGSYTISAYATSVPGEIDTDDNGYIDGTVKVTYTATIEAKSYAGGDISVSITMDGSPTGYTTPHAFTGLTGTHTFTVPKHSPEGYVFERWSTSETSTTIAVDSKGTYTAYYEIYGPRLDKLIGRFIESPSAQHPMLTSGQVDIWPDIRDPVILRDLQDDGFTVIQTQEAFLYYHIDVNVRDQVGNGTHIPLEGGTFAECWRNPDQPDYYSYQGGEYEGYVPLDDIYFRHALAQAIPKDEIVATVYGGISGAAIDSLIPEAQRAWYTPGVDGHPLALGDPFGTTVWDGNVPGVNHDSCSILRAGGYVFDPDAPNPVDKYSPDDPDGNWIDPATGEAMNQIVFAGVTEDIWPDSYGRDDMCYRNWRSIGLPISHPEIDYGYLTDIMMDYYQYDMYALGWSIGRFPDHLYDFFHSGSNFCPEGYNIPGVNNSTLDGYLEIIQTSSDVAEIKAAAASASALLAELCVSIPTVTRPLNLAAGHAGTTAFDDTVGGIVNSPGFGADTADTYTGLYWHGNVDPDTNPYGTGGTMSTIIPSEPTNYHPAFASTPDEWLVMQNVVESLTNIDPYTHDDIPWLATSWTVEDWDYGGSEMGMKTTFTLREDVDWHDGTHFDAYDCEFSLEWLKDMQIGRAQAMWQYLDHVEVHDQYCFSVYHTVASLWTFYDIAGWAAYLPPHIYDGTDIHFRPEMTANPLNPDLTCIIGTGPYMITNLDFSLGGYVELTAYRENDELGIETHWWQSVEGFDNWLETCFHWIGDGNSDGVIDILDQTKAGKAFGTVLGQPLYDPEADTAPEPTYHTNDGRVDMRDIIELSKNWHKQRTYD